MLMRVPRDVFLPAHQTELVKDLTNAAIVKVNRGERGQEFFSLESSQVTIEIEDWVPRRMVCEKEMEDGGTPANLEFTLVAMKGDKFTFDVEILP